MGFKPTIPSFALKNEDSNFVDKGKIKKLEDLSKGGLIQLMGKLSEIRKKKHKRRKDTKYGNINRGFTEKELKQFFECCENKKAYFGILFDGELRFKNR